MFPLAAPAYSEEAIPYGEWHHYGRDKASSRYSPLAQIHRENVGSLVEVWRWSSPDAGIEAQNDSVRPGVFNTTHSGTSLRRSG